MKAKGYQIDALKGAIQKEYKGALIFGYDDSMIDEYARKIGGMIVPNIKDDFAVIEITPAKFKENPSVISDEMNAMSLMGGRRVVWVKGVTDAMSDAIEEVIKTSESDSFLLMTGGALTKSNGTRLFCEVHDKILTVVCYADEAQDIRTVISNTLSVAGYRITPEAMALLQSLVGQSRGVTRSELEKLITYQGNDKLITEDVVARVIDDSGSFSFDSLVIAILDGDHKRVNVFYEALAGAGETPVAFVRLLSQYFNKMLMAVDMLAQKKTMEEALKKILTPAQFKLKVPMMRYLSQWDKKNLMDVLNLLMETEKNTKSGLPAELIVARCIMSITARAGKMRR